MTETNPAMVLMGAGKMGLAILQGWARAGLAGPNLCVLDPCPTAKVVDYCAKFGAKLNPMARPTPDILFLAIKPQALDDVSESITALAEAKTLLISILAGKSVADLSVRAPKAGAIVRAMPNTPAAVGRGVTGAFACAKTTPEQHQLADRLLAATGAVVWLENESQMDVVTAVSGSGPAYVYALTECLAQAGEAVGLPKPLAQKLARATVEGAGELMRQNPDIPPERLRANVTSPGGTTQAAIDVLNKDQILRELMTRAVTAAADRARALSG